MKRIVAATLLIATLCLGITSASTQDNYPNRPVKVLVPFAPGGATDIAARIIADGLRKMTGQPFVIINKPGAFGMLAIDEMVKSDPDGYTLMIGSVATNAITPIIYADKMNTDYAKSVVAVTNLVNVPAFLVVINTNDFPPKTVAEFVDYAKKKPGKVSYGAVGVGSYSHYDMAYFAKRAGDLDLVSLPNKNGAASVVQDMLRGDVQVAFLNAASVAGQVQAGKFRALAVVNDARLAGFPDIPTMKEAGYADVGTVAWNGLFASARTPKPVLAALFKTTTQALQSPDVVEKLQKQSFNIVLNPSPDDANVWLAGEINHWRTITQSVKLEAPQ